MVALVQLWLPILLSAVFVFIASSIVHMVLKFWHAPDYRGFSNEDEVRAAIRKTNPSPGMYMVPWCTAEQMKNPEMAEKFKQGPVGLMFLRPNGMFRMGSFLGLWFVFCLIVALFSAYLAGHVLAPGTPCLQVLRVVGTVAFLGYGFGPIPNGIWRGQPWGSVIKDVIDGLVYALITGATFCWLWPQ